MPSLPDIDDSEFDRALIAAAFEQAAERGWHRMSVAASARAAGLPLDRARTRFPGRAAVLLRFGRMADGAALAGAASEGSTRDRLFDLLMRRLDFLQAHRAGVLALLRALPIDPCTALLLAGASLCSMRWMLAAAGVTTAGPLGTLRAKGLLAVWLWTLRAWQRDTSDDLAPTMAALDQALLRAGQAATWLSARRPSPAAETPPAPEPDAPTEA